MQYQPTLVLRQSSCLRPPYAPSSTETVWCGTRVQFLEIQELQRKVAIVLRSGCVVSGTAIARAALQDSTPFLLLPAQYGMCGTELAYAATRVVRDVRWRAWRGRCRRERREGGCGRGRERGRRSGSGRARWGKRSRGR
eukprot:3940772-Rhodomonas_salina.4